MNMINRNSILIVVVITGIVVIVMIMYVHRHLVAHVARRIPCAYSSAAVVWRTGDQTLLLLCQLLLVVVGSKLIFLYLLRLL